LIDRLPDRGRALVGTALSVASPREVDGLAGDWSNVRDELESDERERGDLAFVARRTELVAGTKAGKLLEKQWTVLMDRRKQFTERDFVCLAKRLLELYDQVGKPKPEGAAEIDALEVPA
jgi:hypothetical protein